MKKRIFYCGILLALLLGVGSCRERQKDLSCKLLVYARSIRTFQIDFNGKDSIETKCGLMDKVYGPMITGNPSVARNRELDSVYVVKKCKLSKQKADEIIHLIKRIKSKVVTDTLMKDVNGFFNFALYLPKQTVAFELVDTGDKDVNRLLEMLINSSPYYVNTEIRQWWGQKYEDSLIREDGKHKFILPKIPYKHVEGNE